MFLQRSFGKIKNCLFFLLLLGGCTSTAAEKTRTLVAASSSFTLVLNALKQEDSTLFANTDFSFASTGKLCQQLNAGAPFALFFCAEPSMASTIRYHKKQDFALASLWICYWAEEAEPVELLLQKPQVRLGIANPSTAPFGALAEKYLQKKGWEHSNAIRADNVAAVAKMLQEKHLDIGFVANAYVNKLQEQGCQCQKSEEEPLVQSLLLLDSTNTQAASIFKHFESKKMPKTFADFAYIELSR